MPPDENEELALKGGDAKALHMFGGAQAALAVRGIVDQLTKLAEAGAFQWL